MYIFVKDILMVQLQRVRYGYLQFGVVVLSFAVQMDPDAGHSERMGRLGFVNVRNWNALKRNRKRW